MTAIIDVFARQILDSRGNPTVEVDVTLEDGSMGRAAVPSGASTGAHEAVELRDGDKSVYLGKGVLKAVEAVNNEILDAIGGMDAEEQVAIDETMIELDGTPEQGAARRQRHPRRVARGREGRGRRVGPAALSLCGRHAGPRPAGADDEHHQWRRPRGQPDRLPGIHDPARSARRRSSEAVRMGAEVFHTLKKALKDAGHNTNVGDEGGFAPNLPSAEAALDFIMKSIEQAGYKPGKDIVIGLDCAATEFFKKGAYVYEGDGQEAEPAAAGRVPREARLRLSHRDDRGRHGGGRLGGLEDADRSRRRQMPARGRRSLRHQRRRACREGIKKGVANSLLVKVNQIGSLTETLAAVDMAHRAGYTAVMSHRSGETEDSTIADLAVATNCGQIKTGSLARSDRTGQVQPAHPHRGGTRPAGALCRTRGAEGAGLNSSFIDERESRRKAAFSLRAFPPPCGEGQGGGGLTG